MFATLAFPLASAAPASSTAPDTVVKVARGESIQAAIDKASAHTVIEISQGTYNEQLLITTDGITLRGRGTVVLAPPATLKPNVCKGITIVGPDLEHSEPADTGICIVGDVTTGAFDPVLYHKPVTVKKAVADVTVTNLAIRDFPTAVIVAGGEGTTVGRLTITGAQSYGVLAASSPHSSYESNTLVNGPGTVAPIGLCMENSPHGELVRNSVRGYVNGLCLSSSNLIARANRLSGNHFGIYVDPGVSDVVITGNDVLSNTRVDAFPITGIGIFVEGASDVSISNNTITGNDGDNSKADMPAGGLVVVDNPKHAASNIRVFDNRFARNGRGIASADISVTAKTPIRKLVGNTCRTSLPAGLCR